MGILDMKFFKFLGFKHKPKAPWKKYYSKKEMEINPPNVSIHELNRMRAEKWHDKTAISYFGTKYTYDEFHEEIDKAARAFRSQGIRKGDIVSILSANVPEALFAFYGLNKIGAVANMLHPLLSENEIKQALQNYSTVMLVAMDITYSKLKNIIDDTEVYKTVIISAKDSMPLFIKLGYEVTQGRKVEKPKAKNNRVFEYWKDFIKHGENYSKDKNEVEIDRDTPAVILQSGGSTGTPKGIVLSNGNFNASTIQATHAYPDLCSDDVILGILPIFHGLGLEVGINDAFYVGAEVVLIPTFKASEFDKLITKHKPTVLLGVPTLFEALTTNERMEGVSLSQLKYVIAGGDTFNKTRVNKINDFLHEHGAQTNMIQGYGMTEAVAAVCVDLRYASRPGTIGIPWPGSYLKIVKPGTDEEVPVGEDGEIVVCGPTVMLGYYNNEKETNDALRFHKDGNLWLHTGDIGSMDKDGFFSYKQRLKRMIVTSGYNVYPSQIEEVLEQHEAVLDATVIGVPHPYKVEVGKAYIALNKGYTANQKLKDELMELCKKNLAHYAIPKEWEFRKSLPKTIVGKVDFRKLQEENNEKRAEEKYGKRD
jgi:long-chain acyl-CoA synthetase